MRVRLLATLAAVLTPLAFAAADDDNPYKNAKVGESATYKTTMKVAGVSLNGTTTQTVTAKTDKEATVKTTATVNGTDVPPAEQKIDLTRPYDPTKGGPLPAGTELNVEKGKDGKEKLKIGAKEYDCTWTVYKAKGKAGGQPFDAELKVWTAREAPLGVVRSELTMTVADQKVEATMELAAAVPKPQP